MTEPVLSVRNLSISFRTPHGEVPAVMDVSYDLYPGEVLGIVGESGSGKTVSCRTIMGLLPRSAFIRSGEILLKGVDLLQLSPAELARLRGEKIAMIFQNPSSYLDPLMTSGAQIGEALKFHYKMPARERRFKAINLLRDVRIVEPERRVDAFPHELSGGMKQRVMIAGALACSPEIMIADEPTTGLDVTVQAGILKLLKSLQEEHNLSMIMVSHDLGVIAQMCDRVVVMKDGLVVEQGTTRSILRSPQTAYTKKLIQSYPSLHIKPQAALAVKETQAEPLLTVKDLSVRFGGKLLGFGKPAVRAVQSVSFHLRKGETLGLVGESGSGKSTIARAIVRLIKPQSGTIRYNGKPVEGLSGKEMFAYRKAVQMVFQDPFSSLNPRMTVGQTIAEPLRKHSLVPADQVESRVKELLEWVELNPNLLNRRPHELSGGQSQRVGIARALTLNPEVLIADEITSALDVTIQSQILELLEKLRTQMNLSILLISHDLGVVQRLCHYVLVMRGGQLIEYGPTGKILLDPQEDYTRQLIEAVPHMEIVTEDGPEPAKAASNAPADPVAEPDGSGT